MKGPNKSILNWTENIIFFKLISTSKLCAEHPFAGHNTQQMWSTDHDFCIPFLCEKLHFWPAQPACHLIPDLHKFGWSDQSCFSLHCVRPVMFRLEQSLLYNIRLNLSKNELEISFQILTKMLLLLLSCLCMWFSA